MYLQASKTTVDVAVSFCEEKWDILSALMREVLEVDASKDDCALILNELMMNELIAEQEQNKANQASQEGQ